MNSRMETSTAIQTAEASTAPAKIHFDPPMKSREGQTRGVHNNEGHNSAHAGGNVTKRVSLDPLAKTDRYKLVIPFARNLAEENLSR